MKTISNGQRPKHQGSGEGVNMLHLKYEGKSYELVKEVQFVIKSHKKHYRY